MDVFYIHVSVLKHAIKTGSSPEHIREMFKELDRYVSSIETIVRSESEKQIVTNLVSSLKKYS
jgi:hypothetical protein